jgi:hypothetical protein
MSARSPRNYLCEGETLRLDYVKAAVDLQLAVTVQTRKEHIDPKKGKSCDP